MSAVRLPEEPVRADTFLDSLFAIASAGINAAIDADRAQRALEEYRCSSCVDGCARCGGTGVVTR